MIHPRNRRMAMAPDRIVRRVRSALAKGDRTNNSEIHNTIKKTGSWPKAEKNKKSNLGREIGYPEVFLSRSRQILGQNLD
jgi:hypothetical protein